MTGRDVKEVLTQTLRSHVWMLEHVHEVEEACAEALAALEPCVVLTEEEAETVRTLIRRLQISDVRVAVTALLTPQKVPL